jgi:type II secretory pathway component PulC
VAKKKNTPEEELLSLIEKDNDSDISDVRIKRKRKLFFLSVFNLKKHFQFLFGLVKDFFSKIKKFLQEPNLKVLNKLLIMVVLLLAVYLAIDFVLQRENINNIYKKKVVAEKTIWDTDKEKETLPFLYYLEMVQRRNVFSPIELDVPEEEEKKEKENLTELSQGLKLVGISLGENPSAMIEDKDEGKTHFLTQGDKIREFKVESILIDKVILSYEGKKIDLM